ncbi:MAG TPA: isoprenylcysteine carboxylmethyltransferase family protein [Longimicrobiales bacterium]|nr:isoprenylcysteine carboxylmethyltransferase family protein [Longimicrobiales bacterium]
MPLREEMESAGHWLFRWRSYLPLGLLALVLAVTATGPDAHARPWYPEWLAFCLAVAVAGQLVRVFTVAYVPAGTSGRQTSGQVAEHLNTGGMYALVRHPLYVGNFLMWLGPALYPFDGWLAAVVVLVFWVYYERIMFAEEEYLRRSYGEPYERWAARTPAFIPRLAGWHPPELPFSFRTVLRRELSSFFGLVSVFTAVELANNLAHGRTPLTPPWLIFFGSGLLIFLVLAFLKKKTRVLRVEGR